MKNSRMFALALAAVWLAGCGSSGPSYRLYVSNEASGDLTVIDAGRMEAVETVALGKRARGSIPAPTANGSWWP